MASAAGDKANAHPASSSRKRQRSSAAAGGGAKLGMAAEQPASQAAVPRRSSRSVLTPAVAPTLESLRALWQGMESAMDSVQRELGVGEQQLQRREAALQRREQQVAKREAVVGTSEQLYTELSSKNAEVAELRMQIMELQSMLYMAHEQQPGERNSHSAPPLEAAGVTASGGEAHSLPHQAHAYGDADMAVVEEEAGGEETQLQQEGVDALNTLASAGAALHTLSNNTGQETDTLYATERSPRSNGSVREGNPAPRPFLCGTVAPLNVALNASELDPDTPPEERPPAPELGIQQPEMKQEAGNSTEPKQESAGNAGPVTAPFKISRLTGVGAHGAPKIGVKIIRTGVKGEKAGGGGAGGATAGGNAGLGQGSSGLEGLAQLACDWPLWEGTDDSHPNPNPTAAASPPHHPPALKLEQPFTPDIPAVRPISSKSPPAGIPEGSAGAEAGSGGLASESVEAAAGPVLQKTLDYKSCDHILCLTKDMARMLLPPVPPELQKEHGSVQMPVAVVDESGRAWEMTYRCVPQRYSYEFRSGWKAFAAFWNVGPGDTISLWRAASDGSLRIKVSQQASLGAVSPAGAAAARHAARRTTSLPKPQPLPPASLLLASGGGGRISPIVAGAFGKLGRLGSASMDLLAAAVAAAEAEDRNANAGAYV